MSGRRQLIYLKIQSKVGRQVDVAYGLIYFKPTEE